MKDSPRNSGDHMAGKDKVTFYNHSFSAKDRDWQNAQMLIHVILTVLGDVSG